MRPPIYNFAAGPAMLPPPVMQQVKNDLLDFQGMGVSVIEISHRSPEFEALLAETDSLVRQISGLGDSHEVLYMHGGAQMLFSAVPLNLMGLKPQGKAQYVETGNFAKIAAKEAEKFGTIEVVASGAADNYRSIPALRPDMFDQAASYVHVTGNNTLFGTQYQEFPDTGDIPLVVDMTSEIFSRQLDYSKFAVTYAGAQKNLGPSGITLVFVEKSLLGKARKDCPKLLDFQVSSDNHSMANTINTFAVYVMNLVLKWILAQGGVPALEAKNKEKAGRLYQVLDNSEFYQSVAQPAHRSVMNVCFNLSDPELLPEFLASALDQGLYALKGHRSVGGARASIYNAMPMAGVEALAQFMADFEQKKG